MRRTESVWAGLAGGALREVGTHAVEVGEAVLALDLVDSELDVSERLLLVLVQVGERELEDSTLEGVVGVLCRFEERLGSAPTLRNRKDQSKDALRP